MSLDRDHEPSLPVWVLKWKMLQGGRGRKHAALFIANPDHVDDHPLNAAKCEGTLYGVEGSPFGGFALNIKRNWDSAGENRLESAVRVASINQQHVHIPTDDGIVANDSYIRSKTDRIAFNIRPPGPTARAWIAVEVIDCQDWVLSFVEELVRQRVVEGEATQSTKSTMDGKTALMAAPGQTPALAGQPSAPAVIWMTASTMTALHSDSTTQGSQPSSRTSRQSQGQREWNDERSRFERRDSGSGRWEYYDGTQRRWIAF